MRKGTPKPPFSIPFLPILIRKKEVSGSGGESRMKYEHTRSRRDPSGGSGGCM
jgi:hypothetical protein